MTKQLLSLHAYDALQQRVRDATLELSIDGGGSFRTLTATEADNGVEVPPGSPIVVRASKKGLWTAAQKVKLTDTDPATLDYDGPKDFGAHSLFSHSAAEGREWRHVVQLCLTLFRDAAPDRAANGLGPIPPFRHHVLDFPGLSVLNEAGTGIGRFAATVRETVPSYGEGAGQLLFAKAPKDAGVPELVALYVSPGVDFAEPVPAHVFFTPPTERPVPPTDPYPFGAGYNGVVANYLVGGQKRLLNQLNASGKKCVFALPVTPREHYFPGLLPSSNLRRFLLEAAYWLGRVVGNTSFPTPRLAHCAASGFSRAGDILFALMQTSIGSQFPELKEVYCLDVVHGEGAAGAAEFLTVAQQWKQADPARRARVYEHYSTWKGASTLAPRATHRSGSAQEWQGLNATLASAPKDFWWNVFQEDRNGVLGYFDPTLKEAQFSDNLVHQVMPGIFLEHALRNSAFPHV